MKTLSEWLTHHIKANELNNNCFGDMSPSTIGEYRNSRRFPKRSAYNLMCEVFELEESEEQYFEFQKKFVKNGKR